MGVCLSDHTIMLVEKKVEDIIGLYCRVKDLRKVRGFQGNEEAMALAFGFMKPEEIFQRDQLFTVLKVFNFDLKPKTAAYFGESDEDMVAICRVEEGYLNVFYTPLCNIVLTSP